MTSGEVLDEIESLLKRARELCWVIDQGDTDDGRFAIEFKDGAYGVAGSELPTYLLHANAEAITQAFVRIRVWKALHKAGSDVLTLTDEECMEYLQKNPLKLANY